MRVSPRILDATPDELEASRRAVDAWNRVHPIDSGRALRAWLDSLREVFGDPPVERHPTPGSDFRI